MTDFDPAQPVNSQEDFDAYARWCFQSFKELAGNNDTPRTYLTGFRAAATLFVAAIAPIALDPAQEQYEIHLANLGGLAQKARCLERHHAHLNVNDILVCRAVLDCFEPSGHYARRLLDAAKCALGAIILVNTVVLENPWQVDAPDVWGLVLMGGAEIEQIPAGVTYETFTVRVSGEHVQRMQMDRANQIARRVGAPLLSPN